MPINEIDIEQLPSGQIGISLEIDQGLPGPANTLAIGTVTSGPAPSATITGSAPQQTLNLVLPKGDTGSQGLKGDKGDQGEIGLTGPANSLSIGTVTSGETAAATITGTAPAQVLNLVLEKGDKGDQGDAATISLGTVTTSAAGSNASITNSGTSGDAVFNFSIPRGDKGETGSTGPANTLTIAGVTTGAAGSSASVTLGGTSPNQTITFTIPRGDKGETGDVGPIGPANTLTVDSVTTGAAGSSASVSIGGTAPNQTISFSIPRGDTGAEPTLNVTDNPATAITLSDTNNNRIVRCTSSSAVTVTVPSTLASGFSCMVIQAGAGQVTFAAGSGATLNSFGNLLKTAGQHAPASIIRVGAGIYNLSGNLA